MKRTLQNIKNVGWFKTNVAHLNIMVRLIKESPADVYTIIQKYGGEPDTLTRETIFLYIADKYYDGDYNKIYNRWLNSESVTR